jgi:hypothetical protein
MAPPAARIGSAPGRADLAGVVAPAAATVLVGDAAAETVEIPISDTTNALAATTRNRRRLPLGGFMVLTPGSSGVWQGKTSTKRA